MILTDVPSSPCAGVSTLSWWLNSLTRGEAILDLILTNLKDYYKQPQSISPIGLSDHNFILCLPVESSLENETFKVKSRNCKSTRKIALGRWLSNINWSNLYHASSCDHKLEILHTTLEYGLDLYMPCKTVKRHISDKPWITDEFKKTILNRLKAFCHGNKRLRLLTEKEKN